MGPLYEEPLDTAFVYKESMLDNIREPSMLSVFNDELPLITKEVSTAIKKLKDDKTTVVDKKLPLRTSKLENQLL